MASMQKSHEERAQSAAQKAADELGAARREQIHEAAPGGGGGANAGADYAEEGKAKAKASGAADAAMGKAAEAKDAAAEKARGAMDAAADRARGVRDAAAGMAEGAREHAAERAASAGTEGESREEGDEEEDVMLRVKAADHMTGQAFNDVGLMGEEGTGMPRRRG